MKRLTCLAAAACFLALTSCSESQQTEDMAADAKKWEPGIYSAARQDDGVVLSVVLLAEKKMQFYAGERLLAAFWTCADAPTDVSIAVRDGGLVLGSGITTSADRLGLGEVVFSDGFPDLKAGVNDIVLGTEDGQVPFGVRLIPSTGKEMQAIRNHQPVGRANPVSTGDPPEQESVEKPSETPPPKPDHSSKSESATGIEVDWGGVKMTAPEPRILPASIKEKIRERMSPREIVTTFGKGWMSKHSSVGSISWRFEDGSMIHMNYRPGTTLVDEAVDVYRYVPPKKEGETIKTDKGGGSASYMSMLQVSRRPLLGDFQGARFPAAELRHLNELLAKGAVNDDWNAIAQKEDYKPWSSYTLRGEFTYAGEPFVRVEIKAFRKPAAGSDLFDLKHIVILLSSHQAGRKVVYTDNPDLVAYVEGDLIRKLAKWNPELEQERFPGGPYILQGLEGIPGQDLTVTHKQSKVGTSLGEMTVTESYRGDSLTLKKVVPPDKTLNTVYYVIHNGYEVLTYKCGPAGTEFSGAGVIRDMVKPDYTIKMAGDKQGRIQRITLYSPDFSKTYEGFWLRNNELIPWTAEELAGWRKMRDAGTPDRK